jgi:hypothetical protein
MALPVNIPASSKVEDTLILVKRKAVHTLVLLAVAIPDVLMTLFEQFEEKVYELIHSDTLISHTRKTLLEFLITIVYNTTIIDQQKKEQLFSRIAVPAVKEFSEFDIRSIKLQNGLLKVLGLDLVLANGILRLLYCFKFTGADRIIYS